MKNAMKSMLVVLFSCIVLFSAGCTVSKVAGTETGNPDISNCVKRMAKTSFDALDTKGEWQPTHYLSSSASVGIVLVKKHVAMSRLCKLLIVNKPDTIMVGDSIAIIYDTTIVSVPANRIDTIVVNKTIFTTDTVSDTSMSIVKGDSTWRITTKRVDDSISVHDTVFIPYATTENRKRVVITVLRNVASAVLEMIRSDTMWLDLGQKSNVPATGTTKDTTNSGWQVSDIVNKSDTSASMAIVNVQKKDTIVVTANPRNVTSNSSQTFLSTCKLVKKVVVEKIDYNQNDSLMKIMRYNPFNGDTVETLTVAYTLDEGSNTSSDVDDRLFMIRQNNIYRYDSLKNMALTISLDPSEIKPGIVLFTKGLVLAETMMNNGNIGIFTGVVDPVQGFVGVYELDKKKYRISCTKNMVVDVSELK